MPKKDFSQVALDVVRRATGEAPMPKEKAPHKALQNKKTANVKPLPKKAAQGC